MKERRKRGIDICELGMAKQVGQKENSTNWQWGKREGSEASLRGPVKGGCIHVESGPLVVVHSYAEGREINTVVCENMEIRAMKDEKNPFL